MKDLPQAGNPTGFPACLHIELERFELERFERALAARRFVVRQDRAGR
jgi:hypothetical protein